MRRQVVDFEGRDDPGGWPSTDTVWVFTTAERFAPDEVLLGLEHAVHPHQAVTVPAGCRAVGLWYD